MDRRTLIDDMEALADGTLPAAEADRLKARIAADPELRALFEGYLEVRAATELLADAAPPCRLDFAAVEGALASRRAWRVVLRRSLRIAAAVLVLVVGGWFAVGLVENAREGDGETGPGGGDAVVLGAVPLRAAEDLVLPAETPELLSDYRPTAEGKIQWIDSYAVARAAAAACSRPVLLYIHHPTCPWCLQMNREAFTDPAVVAAADAFVPAMIDVTKMPRELAPLLHEGWPWIGAVDADGETILAFPGLRGPGELAERMAEAARRHGPAPLSWDEIRAAAKALGGEKARQAVLAARRLAAAGRLAEARALLAEAATGAKDPALAADFTRILAAIDARGRFPEIAGLPPETPDNGEDK